jgi:mono/diheme cytochrome c family protein
VKLLPVLATISLVSLFGCNRSEPPQSGVNEPVSPGRIAFEKHQCAVCHREGGIGKALAGVSTRLKRDEIRAWIADPTKVKPDTLMPKLEMSEAELDAVTDYVMSLK